VGRRDGRDTQSVVLAFEHHSHKLGGRLDETRRGALRRDTGDQTLVVGTGEPEVAVRASL
jgi:hypothetical protein